MVDKAWWIPGESFKLLYRCYEDYTKHSYLQKSLSFVHGLYGGTPMPPEVYPQDI